MAKKIVKNTIREPRRVKPAPKFRLLRKKKSRLPAREWNKLPGSFALLKAALVVFKKNWKTFLGISIIYAVLSALLVQGVLATDIHNAKDLITQIGGSSNPVSNGVTLFLFLAGNSSASGGPGVYQFVLLLMVSLAVVWALRQIYAEKKTKIRLAFYRGMYPFVPVLLILILAIIQLLPFLFVSFLYNYAGTSGLAIGTANILWIILLILSALLSLHLLVPTVIALYIVCLPDMMPMVALRSARDLVVGRRWLVMRKIVVMPIILMILFMLIMLPVIIFATAAAPFVFFCLGIVLLPIVHGYLYRLYRELIQS